MNLTDINVIKTLMAKHSVKFSKSKGQNFLINPSVCPRMADSSITHKNMGVIEIGSGVGVLTKELAERAEKVVCIEIDGGLLPILDETLAEFDNVKIINDDVMKIDLKKVIEENFGNLSVAVCANLPYYITSPIIMKILESDLPIESITVMVQKEAAERLCAKVGDRKAGAVTVAVNYYARAKKLFDVSRGSFLPAPNVDSSVIQLEILKEREIQVSNEEQFFKVVRAAFEQRRKTLANSVSSVLSIPKEKVISSLKECGIRETARAEELTMREFSELARALFE